MQHVNSPRLLVVYAWLAGSLWLSVTVFMFTLGWPQVAQAQVANYHPCNAQPALPVCQYGYGKRIAVRRWGAKPNAMDPDALAKAALTTDNPAAEREKIKASAVIVQDLDNGALLFERNVGEPRPIASITKLMTALVIVDSGLDLQESITIAASDLNLASEIPTRLAVGTSFTRMQLLGLALTGSDNNAAHALGRSYPGGMPVFVQAMNALASDLGMQQSTFAEPTGLSNDNIASAADLVKLLQAAANWPIIQQFTTIAKKDIRGYSLHNTNLLVGRPDWEILMSKTGTTRLAGDCLAMLFRLEGRNLALVILNSQGPDGTRFGDAVRVRRIVQSQLAAILD